jgi:KUP system potassium uptake protein
MGHFGPGPIRRAWFALVLPALLLNYFGQGAMLLVQPDAAAQAFFRLTPSWLLLPTVGIATLAAIIASQALISGAFSLTRQAIQLGYFPRLDVEHTSHHEVGQVYVPQMNVLLAVSTVLIVIGFQTSSALAAAYGIAVTLTMVVTALLLHVVALERWKWPVAAVWGMTAVFLTIDLAFLGANVLKIASGGWLPLVIGASLLTLMTTWKTGRQIVAARLTERAVPLSEFLEQIAAQPPACVPGTAVFMTAQPTGTPAALAYNVRYNKVLHQSVVILTARTVTTPFVAEEDRIVVQRLTKQIAYVTLHYGFMEDPDIPSALNRLPSYGLAVDAGDVTYFLGRETLIVSARRGMARWREKLFVLMARNAVRATAYFRLPPERVVELGVQVEI